jgi:hypothetical protein
VYSLVQNIHHVGEELRQRKYNESRIAGHEESQRKDRKTAENEQAGNNRQDPRWDKEGITIKVDATLRFLQVRQDFKEFWAMIDTGAQVNVCGEDVEKELEGEFVKTNVRQLRAAFNGIGGVLRWKRVRFDIDGEEVVVVLGIVPALRDVIIFGLRFLEDYKANVDIGANLIGMRGKVYVLSELNNAHFIGVVTVASEDLKNLEEMVARAQLAAAHRKRLRGIFIDYPEVWAGGALGETTIVEHSIELDTPYPIIQRPRRVPMDKQQVVDKELEDMIEKGVIRPSKSSYAQEIVLVKKKDGAWRFCIDYRLLNKHTILDKHPLPRIQDLLRSIKGSKFFIALDLRAGYWQISMAERSIHLTAFRTHRGLFEWLRMPFGLVNAPASFQRLMEIVLGDLRWDGVLVYLDDVLLHSATEEGTLNLLDTVFKRFQSAKLTIKMTKCSFFPTYIEYLGHIVEAGVIRPNPQRVDALKRIVRPKNISELRSIELTREAKAPRPTQ